MNKLAESKPITRLHSRTLICFVIKSLKKGEIQAEHQKKPNNSERSKVKLSAPGFRLSNISIVVKIRI